MRAPIDPPFNNPDTCEKYPKILHYGSQHGGLSCVMFEKHDGSNLAWKWSCGSFDNIYMPSFRSGKTIQEALDVFGEAPEVFEKTLMETAENILSRYAGTSEAILFTEFRGDNSFSGEHLKSDVKTLHPIDIWIKGKGFMPPKVFVSAFEGYGGIDGDGVGVVYEGKLHARVVDAIRKGRVGVNEGVIAKGGDWGSVWCCKIKTDAWLARGGEL